APALDFSISLDGQPILISIPSKPSSTQSWAVLVKFSGLPPKIWATIGRSDSSNQRSGRRFFLPSEQRPSQETNSVHKTSGLPYLAMTRRNAASVTSAIGACTMIGVGKLAQNPLWMLLFIPNNLSYLKTKKKRAAAVGSEPSDLNPSRCSFVETPT